MQLLLVKMEAFRMNHNKGKKIEKNTVNTRNMKSSLTCALREKADKAAKPYSPQTKSVFDNDADEKAAS